MKEHALASQSVGRHLLADLYGITGDALVNENLLVQRLITALEKAGFSVLKHCSHKFPGAGYGVTGMVLLCESHAAFHTYPEHGYVALDIFSCGAHDSRAVLNELVEALQPNQVETKEIERGRSGSERPICNRFES